MSSLVSLQSVAEPNGRLNKEPKTACNASFYIEASSLDQVVAELIKRFNLDTRLVLGRRGRKPDNASSLEVTAGAPSTSVTSSSSYESKQVIPNNAYKYNLNYEYSQVDTPSTCMSPDGASINPGGITPISSGIPEYKNSFSTCIYIIRKGNQNHEGFEYLRQQIIFQLACMIIVERFRVDAMQQKVVDDMTKKLQTTIAKALIYKVLVTKQTAQLLFGCKPKLISKAVKVSSIRKVPVGQRHAYYLMELKELLIRKSNTGSLLISNDYED
jgi:hypothetical protein